MITFNGQRCISYILVMALLIPIAIVPIDESFDYNAAYGATPDSDEPEKSVVKDSMNVVFKTSKAGFKYITAIGSALSVRAGLEYYWVSAHEYAHGQIP